MADVGDELMAPVTAWWMGPGADVERVWDDLRALMPGAVEQEQEWGEQLVDTASGALAASKAALVWGPAGAALWSRAAVRVARAPADGVFKLPKGALRRAVKEVVGGALLVARVALWRRARTLRFEVPEGSLELSLRDVAAPDLAAAPRPLAVEVSFTGRGLPERRRELRRRLAQLGFTAGPLSGVEIARAAGLISRGRGLPLDVAAPTAAAVRRLLGGLLEELRGWEAGVQAHDVEALHQWRVALRTARALLGALGDVLGPGARPLRRRLRLLQAETGPLRDLDVHLDQLGEDGSPLAEWLQARRAEERVKVDARLTSARYRKWLARWAALVVSSEVGEGGGDAIAAVARVRAWRAWRVVLEHAEAIDADCTAEALHEVRKDCKRLRYLIELTSSVLEDRAARELLGRLKPLQSVLGAMQDLAVQRETLEAAGAAGASALVSVLAEESAARLRSIEAVRALREPALDRAARVLAGLARAGDGPR